MPQALNISFQIYFNSNNSTLKLKIDRKKTEMTKQKLQTFKTVNGNEKKSKIEF